MITLDDFGNSVCCQKVRITLREKGLDWEATRVDLFKAEQYDPKYLKLNPKGVVPTLVHDGKPVIESTLICEYLDETFPDPPLVPADPWQRSRMRVWSKLVDEGLFEGVTEISFSAMFRERMKTMPNTPERQAVIDRMVEIYRRDAPWVGGFHPVSYGLTHAWMMNGKPNNMARNNLKYLRVDVDQRAELRREWNQPIVWPALLIVAVLVAGSVPAFASYRRRERMAAR